MAEEKQVTDYTALSGPDLLAALGTDATKWAEAFDQCGSNAFGEWWSPPDDWLVTWFSNAMMAQYDECRRQSEEP